MPEILACDLPLDSPPGLSRTGPNQASLLLSRAAASAPPPGSPARGRLVTVKGRPVLEKQHVFAVRTPRGILRIGRAQPFASWCYHSWVQQGRRRSLAGCSFLPRRQPRTTSRISVRYRSTSFAGGEDLCADSGHQIAVPPAAQSRCGLPASPARPIYVRVDMRTSCRQLCSSGRRPT